MTAAAPSRPVSPRIAVIGAGISGAVLSRDLAEAGLAPVVFEKSRGTGGRMATRRREGWQWDHGAPGFPAEEATAALTAKGCAAPWGAELVGLPGMSAPAKALLTDVEVRFGIRITALSRQDGVWHLGDEAGGWHGPFDIVLSAAPGPQIAPVFGSAGIPLPGMAAVAYHPCWTLMVAWDTAPPLVEATGGPVIARLIHDGAKPGRSGHTWVAHAAPDWAAEHLELEPGDAETRLWQALQEMAAAPLPEPAFRAVHRWRYALTARPLDQPCIWRPADSIGLCGDWCLGPSVGDALASGRALAQSVLADVNTTSG